MDNNIADHNGYENKKLTMQMFKERPIRSILKNHHSGKWLLFFTITEKADKVLVIDFGHCINLVKAGRKAFRNSID